MLCLIHELVINVYGIEYKIITLKAQTERLVSNSTAKDILGRINGHHKPELQH